jgi:multidrug resistance protein, MATE family
MTELRRKLSLTGIQMSELANEAWAIARFAYAMVATRIFAFAQGMLIMLLLGRHSPAGMASMSLALAIGQVLIVLGFSALIGTETEVARRHGAKDRAGIGQFMLSAYAYALLVGTLMAVLAVLACLILGQASWAHTGGYVETMNTTLPAILVIGLGLLPYCLYLTSSFYLEATGKPKLNTALSICGLVAGVGSALVLIPDYPGLGLSPGIGAAWALTMARTLQGMLALAIVLLDIGPMLAGAARKFSTAFRDHARALLAIGLPMSLADSTTTVAVSSMTFLVGSLGAAALNTYQISSHFLALLMLIGTGITTGITIRVTHAIGAGDAGAERLATCGGGLLLVLLDVTVLCLLAAFPRLWPSLYTIPADTATFVSFNQIWALLVFALECPLILMIGIGRAKGMTVRLPTIKAACFAGIALPLACGVVRLETPQPFLLASLVPAVAVAFLVAWHQFRRLR